MSIAESEPREVEIPKFPNPGFLRKSIGPSRLFFFSVSSEHKRLACDACGHTRNPNSHFDESYKELMNFGGLQILNGCCGGFLDALKEAGFITITHTDDLPPAVDFKVELIRSMKHPEYKTSQITIAQVQKIIDSINRGTYQKPAQEEEPAPMD